MNHLGSTEHQAQRVEELVSWTAGEQLRLLWYRLRLTVTEMNNATRRMLELQMRLPCEVADQANGTNRCGNNRHPPAKPALSQARGNQ